MNTKKCKCGVTFGICPECGQVYGHGTTDHCLNPNCLQVNAPIDCAGCGYAVSEGMEGVLNYNCELIPWSSGDE